jgi:hypothetical protein
MLGKRWMPVALGAFAAGILMAPTLVAASTPNASGAKHFVGTRVVTHHVSKAQQRATLKYWTAKRMANAKSLDVVRRGAAPTGGAHAAAGANGTAGAVAPRRASGKIVNAHLHGSSSAGNGPIPETFAYPFPFTRFAVAPVSLYTGTARRVNGKVFFTQNGGNFVCSGTTVVSSGHNEVWTAGHCVSNGAGVFDSFAEFVPAYNGNASNCCPFGIFVANSFATSSAWHFNGDFSRDEGAMRVNTNSSGQLLQNRTGAAGFAWNQARDQQFVDFGYPQASPFNGTTMQTCLGATAVYDTGIGGSGPAPDGIGCDMTGGSSGGSWQISWGGAAGTSPGYINGHNDYKYGSQPLAMYSPYFDTTTNAVRCVFGVSGQLGCP